MIQNLEDSLWLVIPTADRHQYLSEIFRNSGIERNRRVLIRTIPGRELDDCVNIYYEGPLNIQAWWNVGIDYAKKHGARYVAVLNDDVSLSPTFLQKMLERMLFDETSLVIPVNKGEAGWGHCWIIDTSHAIKPDERFAWWCGDHDLEIQAKRAKGVSYIPLMVPNLHANELTQQSSEFGRMVKKDMWKFRSKYPHLAIIELLKLVKYRLLK